MPVYILSFLVSLILFGWALKHIRTGRIYVGFGEGYLYGRSWVYRRDDPLLFWTLVIGLMLVAMVYFFMALLNALGDPEWHE